MFAKLSATLQISNMPARLRVASTIHSTVQRSARIR